MNPAKLLLVLGTFLMAVPFTIHAQTQIAESLKNNVVAITTTFDDGHSEYGFGFVTGERSQKLYLATAAHVVSDDFSGTSNMEIQFNGEIDTYPARLLRQDANFDLALLEVDKPANFRWQQTCMAIPGRGQQVTFIGRDRQWFIPPDALPGAITNMRENKLDVEIISIRPGTSGAPLINNQGIAGLIIEDEGSTAVAVAIEQVQESLTNAGQYDYVFSLRGAGIDIQVDDTELQRAQQELTAWLKIKDSEDIADFRNFLRQYPTGNFSDKAYGRIEELEAAREQAREQLFWQITVERDDVEGYNDFIRQFPSSNRISQARRRIKELEVPEKDEVVLRENFVEVKGGSFMMGCTSEQGSDCLDREKPAHKVTVPGFAMSKFEITKREYVAFLNAVAEEVQINGEKVSLKGNDIFELSSRSKVTYQQGRFRINSGDEQHPANEVSWYGAIEYCNWRSRKENRKPYYTISGSSVNFNAGANGYRLPSEAEWEFAARGGNLSRGFKYAGSNDLDAVGWYSSNSGSDTHPIGEKQVNELGLADMSGNVLEWTNDCWQDSYTGAPTGGEPWVKGSCSSRVVRGGQWYYNAQYCRVSNRNSNSPGGCGDYMGFRLVLSL